MKVFCTECGNRLRPLNYWEDDNRCRYVGCKLFGVDVQA